MKKAACPFPISTKWSSARRTIKVRYLDRLGEAHEIHASGLLATCLQHEIDHLDGVLVHRLYFQAEA